LGLTKSLCSLRIFKVLHTVQFSRFFVVVRCRFRQQQLLYLITVAFVCQQLFTFFSNLCFDLLPRFSRASIIIPNP
ncbi:hypothetical protein, partial [[Clostridium] symbiosum]